MIDLEDLRRKAEAATPGPWYPPHFGDEATTCQCKSIVSEGWAGGIASIHVGNGLPISDGGNDAPPPEEAAANGQFIAAANPATILALIAEIDRCHARLEIDHVYRVVDGEEVHESVPYTDRRTVPDGITCRDATINLLEGMIRRAKR